MNPKDIMTDAIHNFHPQYQQYTQYSSGKYFLFLLSTFHIFRLSLNVCCLLAVAIDCSILSFLLCFPFALHIIIMFYTFVFLSVSYLLQK